MTPRSPSLRPLAGAPLIGALLLTACGGPPPGPGITPDVPSTCEVTSDVERSDFKSTVRCTIVAYDAFAPERLVVEPDGEVWQANGYPESWLREAAPGARINLVFRGDDAPPAEGEPVDVVIGHVTVRPDIRLGE